jgi:hypothetical protein
MGESPFYSWTGNPKREAFLYIIRQNRKSLKDLSFLKVGERHDGKEEWEVV